MTDKTTTVAEIKTHIQDFADARNWREGEDAKDLVMAMMIEAAELAEVLLRLDSADAASVRANAEAYEHLQDELADVFWYLCRVCGHFGVDLANAVEKKTVKNARKYPV